MAKSVQKNFSIPEDLSDVWDDFQGQGSKESSKNAAGALFLYMLMPAHVREVCRNVAYHNDIKAAQKNFWIRLSSEYQDSRLAMVLLAAVREHEANSNKKIRGKSPKSG